MSEVTAIMPSGRPAPSLLTEQETIEFLRIQDYTNPQLTLRHYRQQKKLRGTRVGKKMFYLSSELVRFLDVLTNGDGSNGG